MFDFDNYKLIYNQPTLITQIPSQLLQNPECTESFSFVSMAKIRTKFIFENRLPIDSMLFLSHKNQYQKYVLQGNQFMVNTVFIA